MVAAAVLWGTTGTAQALAPDGTTPLGIGAVRLVVGAAVLVALAAGARATGSGALPRSMVAVGAACVAGYQLTFFAAVDRTGVAAGTIVAIGSAPAFAGLLGWAVRRERPVARWWPATALAVAGGALLVAGGSGDDVRLDAAGLLLALGAGASYAGYTVAAKAMLDEHAPLRVMGVLFAGGAVLLAPLLLVEPLGWVAEPRGVAVALHLGVLTVGASYLLFGLGLGGVQVATAGTLTLAEPVTAGLLGMAVLDEALSWLAWVGVVLVFAGLVLLATPRAGGARRTGRPGGAPRRALR